MPRYIEQLTENTTPASGDWLWIVDVSAGATDQDRKLSVGKLALLATANTFTATQTIDNSAGSGLASDIRGASGSNIQRLRTAAGVDVLTALANGDLIAHGYLYTVGINWTSRTSAADNQWLSVAYGNGLFVAVANTGTANRVMSSGKQIENITNIG